MLDWSLRLPRVSALPRCSKPPHRPPQFFSRCVSCTTRCSAHAYASAWGLTATQDLVWGNNIASLFVPHLTALLSAATAFKTPSPPPPPHARTQKNVHKARTGSKEEGKRSLECVAKKEIKNRGEYNWQGWKWKCCCWHKAAYCSSGLLQLCYLTLKLLNTNTVYEN